ncbi:MAG: hypothetical protein LBV32_11795 [Tannerellaceae bacterium]|jgi:hypothetical protein|nr:hypothetical protein [Tannerellaceae bacterium]
MIDEILKARQFIPRPVYTERIKPAQRLFHHSFEGCGGRENIQNISHIIFTHDGNISYICAVIKSDN